MRRGDLRLRHGAHDDLVMALAIAFYIRSQQDMFVKKEPEKELEDVYKALGFEVDNEESDFGSEIKVF